MIARTAAVPIDTVLVGHADVPGKNNGSRPASGKRFDDDGSARPVIQSAWISREAAKGASDANYR